MHAANRSRLSRWFLLGAATLIPLLAAGPAHAATGDTGIGATLLTLDLGAKPRVRFLSKDPGVVLPDVEPVLWDFGTTIEIAVGGQTAAFVAGDGLRKIISATPMGTYRVSPRRARFKNPHAPEYDTQVASMTLDVGRKIKLVAKGGGDVPFQMGPSGLPGGVYVAVTVRSKTPEGASIRRMCTRFTTCSPEASLTGLPEELACVGGVPDPDCIAAGTTCRDADGICPANCTPVSDDDCTPCGHGPEFVGLCDGTTLDLTTGRQWEMKSVSDGVPNPDDLHDMDNRYSWSGRCGSTARICQPNAAARATCLSATGDSEGCDVCPMTDFCITDANGDGTLTTIWDWLNRVNAEELGGLADWRVPAYPAELADIRPRIDQFGGAAIGSYWTASRIGAPAGSANATPFDGRPDVYVTAPKSTGLYVRAYR